MSSVTLEQVRTRCSEGRFYAYGSWRDRLFVPPSILLVWVFVRLGWTGNAVSFLSGAFALLGACLLAFGDPVGMVVGAFGYMVFYLLDYVDGGVARFRGEAGIGGQYVDWVMHAVSSVGIASGLFVGAFAVEGPWVIPFGVLTVVAAALTLDRYSFAWFSICMHYQQRRARGDVKKMPVPDLPPAKRGLFRRAMNRLSAIAFHEDFAIFTLPLLAGGQYLWPHFPMDFRVLLIVLGGVVYFPAVVVSIWKFAAEGRVDEAYAKLFFGEEPPKLPEDHFLE